MAKNIILLSDGTGNSSAKLLKTNVWRVYESLDLSDPHKQVACYDDGVGTSTFKPLTLLGGAMGVGLHRNVMRLYRFLCEHYDPGDRIYLFGFSRGAFTVRVLAGLILNQSIIQTRPTLAVKSEPMHTAASEDDQQARTGGTPPVETTQTTAPPSNASEDLPYGKELRRLAAWEYRAYRKKKFETPWLVRPLRILRDVLLGSWQAIWLPRHGVARRSLPHGWRAVASWKTVSNPSTPKHTLDASDGSDPEQVDGVRIAFMGVWDTVDAYGLPVDEMTEGIDRWIWPLSFRDQKLNPLVDKACHALALDDERNTFHPVLWDESGEPSPASIKLERITQVWFAGMHANVGGGYADDALSGVSLTWMIQQIEPQLVFMKAVLDYHLGKTDLIGRIYDSRAGLKAYYRYQPRQIKALCNAKDRHDKPLVRITCPKIHESVFARIAAAPEAYAPIGLPADYALVRYTGEIEKPPSAAGAGVYETASSAKWREQAQARVWDFVWLRRIVYFSTLAVTLTLVALPFVGDYAKRALASPDTGAASELVGTLVGLLPTSASSWTALFTARPRLLLVAAAIIGLLTYASSWLQSTIGWEMRRIWLRVVPPYAAHHAAFDSKPMNGVRYLRLQGVFFGGGKWLQRRTPELFAIALLIVTVIVGYHTLVGWRDPMQAFCASATNPSLLKTLALHERSREIRFSGASPCQSTYVRLEAGGRYHVQFAIDQSSSWGDGDVRLRYTPRGFGFDTPGLTWSQKAVFLGAAPLRRVWAHNWFTPFAQIGSRNSEIYALNRAEVVITPQQSGELFLFVNDALMPWDWISRYANNTGTATVVVTRDWKE